MRGVYTSGVLEYLLEQKHYNDTVAFVEKLKLEGKATVIRPDGTLAPKRLEKDISLLRALFEQGQRDATLKL